MERGNLKVSENSFLFVNKVNSEEIPSYQQMNWVNIILINIHCQINTLFIKIATVRDLVLKITIDLGDDVIFLSIILSY